MFKKIVIAAALSQLLVVGAFAQATRAEVKAEAAAAEKAGTLPKGEISAAPAAKSTKARADVKKEAASAEKAGAIVKGDKSDAPVAKSTKNRKDVKAEAAAAEKAGTIPKGEGTK